MTNPVEPQDTHRHRTLSGTVSAVSKFLATPVSRSRKKKANVGSSPGIEFAKGVDQRPEADAVRLECIDFGKESMVRHTFSNVEELISHPLSADCDHRWINVEILHPYIINELRKAHQFHTLAAEDVLNTPQRPKLELYENHSLVIADMVRIVNEGELVSEQVSFIVMENLLITFQEKTGDVWDPIRERIKKPNSRFRSMGIWYLAYALLDAVVDSVYPILEHYGDVLYGLEQQVMEDPKPSIQQHIYLIKRELFNLRRSMWPVRELASKLAMDEASPAPPDVRVFMRDVQDHSVQIIDLIENSRETANGLQDFYISIVSNRMNEVMKALTIMASLFLPITFFAGVYGMNFDVLPELHWDYSYLVFWLVCILSTGGLLWYFKRKGWIGK
ncbi:magnesium/cobalt transporter CorA [Pelagicoccus sp. SDUM812003]|uniref:magnesium/cobalt transporter CorA n=1 Tax=Pelagicoccus sp. SDUM812003 TaxID=3041267 RepID=UPI00280D5F54|nr:magnesium/cobalt transporter CorA [Pelagicoccus sp. SDUM812003]MDQ8205265.1 magnesium/cobalt transporter CorA [Pelagicoccus sp. SDUM812003]